MHIPLTHGNCLVNSCYEHTGRSRRKQAPYQSKYLHATLVAESAVTWAAVAIRTPSNNLAINNPIAKNSEEEGEGIDDGHGETQLGLPDQQKEPHGPR